VYRIGKVSQPAQADQARRAQEAESISRAVGASELYGYVEALKHKAKAKVNVKPAELGAKSE
jgi:peptidyl-prolyl cis-trans isomerase D